MSLLTRDDLLKPAPRRYADFQAYDGRAFRVRSLTERERSEFEAGIMDGNGKLKRERLLSARRRLICLTLVGADNELLFNQHDEATMKSLAEQDGKLMDSIYEAAATHCGIKNSEVETLVKNSDQVHVVD